VIVRVCCVCVAFDCLFLTREWRRQEAFCACVASSGRRAESTAGCMDGRVDGWACQLFFEAVAGSQSSSSFGVRPQLGPTCP